MPSGPIPNVFALLDSVGVVAVVRYLGAAGQDAFSTWPPGGAPLMVLNSGMPVDRLRFTAAHELGHLVMHVMPNDDQEQQANLFASELLAPAAEIVAQLEGLTTRDFSRLMELKAEWKLSIAALIQRALTLGTISDRQFREFRMKLGRLGWTSAEPIDLPDEAPALLDSVIRAHREDRGYTDEHLARLAQMSVPALRHHYLHDEPSRLQQRAI